MESLEQRLAKLRPDQRAALEARLAKKSTTHVSSFQVPKRNQDEDGMLSFAQERFWFLDNLVAPSNAFNTGFALRLVGDVDEKALSDAFEQLLLRHASLIMTFPIGTDGRPVANLLPADGLPSLSVNEAVASLAVGVPDAVSSFLQQPFNLADGPLIRAKLFPASDGNRILAIGMHHIIVDAHSLGLILKDLERLYSKMKGNFATAEETPTLEYADFARWQRSPSSLKMQERDLDYWSSRLRDAPPILELPLDHPRPVEQSYRGNQLFRKLPNALGKGVTDLANQTGATAFMILLAAFKILLSRTSGKDDIVVGTPSAHWPDERLRDVVGPFINMLPLRSQVRRDASTKEFIDSLKSGFLEALEHQSTPFERIVESLNPKRDMGVSPFFQVAFMYQIYGDMKIHLGDCRSEQLRLPSQSAKYDLTLMVLNDGNDHLELAVEYSTDLFNETTILRYLERMECVIESIVHNLDTSVGEIRVIPRKEKEQLISMGRGPVTSYPRDKTVLDHVERIAETDPSRRALIEIGGNTTYKSLYNRANTIANILHNKGVRPNARVAVCLKRSSDLIPALLAILRIGATYIPLDPMFPADRLAFMLEDSQASLLLHDDSAHPALFEMVPARLDLLELGHTHPDLVETTLPSIDHSDQVAYIIYTSGSTGKPKGVSVPHKALMNFLWSMHKEPGFDETDKLLAVTTISFDISGLELFLPLVCGGSLYLATMEQAVDGDRLIEIIDSDSVSVLQATPATIRLMLTSGWKGDSQLKILCGGETLPKDLAQELIPRCGELWNMYGPTETTIWSTCSRVLSAENIHIGTPINNTTTYIVDDQLAPSPIGSIGELAIGGEGVANGYVNQEKLTTERFRDSPFVSGERIYLTGDLARYREDGNIECLGRRDSQIKLRGYRIELGEIETCLASYPEVRQAAVNVVDISKDNQRLSAYYISENGTQIADENLKIFLRNHLPEYMVPTFFVKIGSLPLTANGKLDRKALPQPSVKESSIKPGFKEPRSPLENRLTELWQEELKIGNLSIDQNLFEMGGHSFSISRIASQLSREMDRQIPLRLFFEFQTVEELAEAVESNQAEANSESNLLPITSHPRQLIEISTNAQRKLGARVVAKYVAPLTYSQRQLWVLSQITGPSSTYNIPFAFSLTGSLDTAALEASLNYTVARHEALRTNIVEVEEEPVQAIREPAAITLETIRPADPDKAMKDYLEWASREASACFDLSEGPLIRARLFLVDGSCHVFAITLHHIICDGASAQILLEEIGAAYSALSKGESAKADPLEIQFADYAVWERELASLEVLEPQRDYWRGQLDGLPIPAELPADRQKDAGPTEKGDYFRVEIAPDLTEKIATLAAAERVSPFVLMLAAFNILLSRYSGQADICVGTPLANRNRPELEGLVGNFMKVVPLRNRVLENETVGEFIRRVGRTVVDAQSNADTPLGFLDEGRRNSGPLFHNLFAFQGVGLGLELNGLNVEPIALRTGSAKFQTSVYLWNNDIGGIDGIWEYDSERFSSEMIERVAGHYEQLLDAMSENPDIPLGQISLVGTEERQALLDRFAPAPYPKGRRVFELFEGQADRTPDSIAVSDGTATLTYHELDARANRIARSLIAMGAGPESLVGLCVGRTADLPAAMLGVLKSGAAYLPLDETYPAERLAYMAEQSGMSILLSRSDLLPLLPFEGHQTLLLDRDREAIASQPDSRPEAAGTPNHLAYVIYTSGSTGRPKGVEIEHRSAVNFLCSMAERPGIGSEDALLAVTTISFDISVLELLLPLLKGGRVHVADRDTALDPEVLKRTIRESGVTIMQATPATWRMMLDSGWEGEPSMKVLCGGEPLPDDLARRLLPACGQLWNMYGPTETTVWSTCSRVDDPEDVHVGGPIANTETLILDAGGQLAPPGLPGELLIGGDGLARGYRNTPGLTEKAFVPHPFKEGERVYRTGDLATYRQDGNIDSLGRVDSQVKIRGHRVELGEIESALANHPSIKRAVATTQAEDNGDQRLVAYLIANDTNKKPSIGSLRDHLHSHIPNYMIPSAFGWIERIPLTDNGKINRKNLPPLNSLDQISSPGFEEPIGESEKTISKLITETLDLERVGRNESFFDIGGHSILAANLFRKIEQDFGTKLPLATLIKNPTTAALARILETSQSGSMNWSSLISIREGGSGTPLFLIHGAGGNILLYRDLAKRLEPGFPIYGLQSLGLDGETTPINNIEEMASHYLKEIRAVQPTGPYQLGGYCMGAKVAFEIARILDNQGDEVKFLALLDSYNFNAPNHSNVESSIWSYYSELFRFHANNLTSLGLTEVPNYIKEKGRMAVEAFRGRFKASVKKQIRNINVADSNYFIQDINDKAGQTFVAKPYKGPATLFKPKRNYKTFIDPKMGWGEVVQNKLTIVTLDLNPHAMLVEPFVKELASAFNDNL